ncbi:ABC transporter substrate-binding protein [Thioalkalivibrio sp.]|uniref:ABC transporter substrate-binding protein n=1 Tax=Thioalkalivibrio sp. TaxID=2093813 RepID=UPI0035687C23
MATAIIRRDRHRTVADPWWRHAVRTLALMVLFLSGCGAPDKPPLRVATIEWIGYQPLNIALDRGELPRDDIRLSHFTSNTESLRAFRNGNVDVAALTLDEALLLRADGHDIRVILLMDYSHGADTILARPGIATLAELEGRRIGVENSAATAYLLARGLEHGDLEADAVEVVRVDAGRHAEAFRRGEVDALATFEPIRSRLLQEGAVELFDSTRIPGEIVDVLVAHRSALQSQRRHLSDLVNAWFRALKHLEQDPVDARAIIGRHTELPPEHSQQALDGVQFPSRADNCRALANHGQMLHDTTGRLAELMRENDLLAGGVELDTLFDNQIVKSAACPGKSAGHAG